MIRRAWPKFLEREMLAEARASTSLDVPGLYFDRGSSALRFLIECLQCRLERPARVALQSFNCVTVLDAVLEAGAEAHLFDISLTDFSLSQASLERPEAVDAVVLLHYQGLRNQSHQEIAAYCESAGILLIEDLAHCTGMSFPVLGNYGIYSFSFDKPFTSLSGGEIVGGAAGDLLGDALRERYQNVAFEDREATSSHLDLLEYRLSGGVATDAGYRLSQRLPTPLGQWLVDARRAYAINTIASIAGRVRLAKGANRARFQPRRMSAEKIALIQLQRRQYESMAEKTYRLAAEIGRELERAFRIRVADAEWNRVSFLDPTGAAASTLASIGIEARNFNWPRVLDELTCPPKVRTSGPNILSSYAAKWIVNVPCWSERVLDLCSSIGRRAK